jgi:hypothetical protein
MYKRWPRAAIAAVILLILENMIWLYLMCDAYYFKAAPLAVEDYYMLSYVLNKPYSK